MPSHQNNHNFSDTPKQHLYRADSLNDLYYFVQCLDPVQPIIIRARPDGFFVWLFSEVEECDHLYEWRMLAGSFVSQFFKF